MAKIPAGLTKRNTPLEDILLTLSKTLEGTKKQDAIEYQNILKSSKLQIEALEKERSAREEAAKSYNLSYSVIETMLKDYDKAIESSIEKFNKTSVEIAKKVEDLSKTEESGKLSKDQMIALKAFLEVSENVKNIKKEEGGKKSSDLAKNVKSSADRLTTALLESSISMFGVVTRPLEDLLGFKISDIVKGGFSKIFNKKEKTEDTGKYLQKKVRPEANSLKNLGVIGASAVFLGNIITKLLGKGKDKDSSGILDNLGDFAVAGGATKGIASTLVKTGGVVSIASGIIWGVVDSISAILKSEEWGTSKIAAGIAGFFAGTGSGELKDAFKGMGKWALIGAGVGTLIAPIVGTIVGGLIGAAIGGILGWIGGEKVAKAFDNIGEYFNKAWDSVKNFFVVTIPNFILSIGSWLEEKYEALKEFFFVKVPEVTRKIWQATKEVFSNIWGFFVNTFISIKNTVSEFLFVTIPDRVNSAWTAIKTGLLTVFSFLINGVMFIGQEIKEFFTVTIPALALSAWEGIKTGVNYIIEKVVAFGTSIKDAFISIYTSVSNAVVGFYNDVINFFTVTLPAWAKEKYNLIVTELKEFFTPAYNAITGFFGDVKEFFVVTIPTWATEKYNEVVTFATGIFDFAKEGVIGFFTSAKNFFMTDIPTFAIEKYNEVVSFASDIFNSAKDGILGFFTNVKEFFTQDIPTFAIDAYNGIKTSISNFFDIPKKTIIGFFDSIGLDISSPTLIKDAIQEISTSFKSVFEKIKNTFTDFLNKMNPITWINDKIEEVKDPNEKSWWQFWKPDVKDVNDALIFKDGNIYRPSADDHIIATKTPPMIFNQEGQVVKTGFDTGIQSSKEYSKEVQVIQSQKIESASSKAFDSMISLLSSILDVLKEKEMAPSYVSLSSPRTLDFEMLR